MAATKNLNNWLDECRCLLGTVEERDLHEAVAADIAEALKTSHNNPSAPCPNCNGRGVGSHNSDGLPNTCLACHGTGTAHVG